MKPIEIASEYKIGALCVLTFMLGLFAGGLRLGDYKEAAQSCAKGWHNTNALLSVCTESQRMCSQALPKLRGGK